MLHPNVYAFIGLVVGTLLIWQLTHRRILPEVVGFPLAWIYVCLMGGLMRYLMADLYHH